MAQALFAATLTFLGALIAGYPLLRLLRRLGVGKQIRSELPDSHQVKVGTLTMGGVLIWASVFAATVVLNIANNRSIVVPLIAIAATGVIGAIDDLLGFMRDPPEGMSARMKFSLLWITAIGIAAAIYFALGIDYTFVPLTPGPLHLGLLYIPLAALVIVGAANAVNLTDGLDSLAGVCAAVAFVAYGIIAHLQGQAPLVTFCFTVAGAILAFLWFNAFPAQLLMGDTGALALGAGLATVALMTEQVLLLPVIGIVFVAETLSVMLQVAYFRVSGGKRIFRMTPLHHHFELLGWSEVHVAQRFWLVSMLAGMVGVALALY